MRLEEDMSLVVMIFLAASAIAIALCHFISDVILYSTNHYHSVIFHWLLFGRICGFAAILTAIVFASERSLSLRTWLAIPAFSFAYNHYLPRALIVLNTPILHFIDNYESLERVVW